MGKLKALGIAIAAGCLIPTAAQADLNLSGQVTPAFLVGGDVDDLEIVDNTGTGSRIRLKGKHKLGGIRFFTRYEIQIQENQSFGAVDGSESIDTRYAEAGIKGNFGTFSIGKGDGAANATGEVSYQVSGNVLGGGHLPFFATRGVLNRDNPGTPVTYTQFDAFSRNSRIRYDTPNFGGLVLSGSVTNAAGTGGVRTELAGRFKRKFGIGKATVLVGLTDTDDGSNDQVLIGAGWKFNFGLSGSVQYGERTNIDAAGLDLDDTEMLLLSVNYQIGKLVVSADFGESGVDGESELTQFGAEYHATKFFDIYAGVANYDNADGSDLSAGFGGFRYKF